MKYEVIGKSYDAQLMGYQESVTVPVIVPLLGVIMDSSIQFNHKTKFGTVEIQDIAAELVLPSELQPQEFSTPQLLPQHILSRCLK
jgi:hypothetical protein